MVALALAPEEHLIGGIVQVVIALTRALSARPPALPLLSNARTSLSTLATAKGRSLALSRACPCRIFRRGRSGRRPRADRATPRVCRT
jgi:hypothetical protein